LLTLPILDMDASPFTGLFTMTLEFQLTYGFNNGSHQRNLLPVPLRGYGEEVFYSVKWIMLSPTHKFAFSFPSPQAVTLMVVLDSETTLPALFEPELLVELEPEFCESSALWR